MQRLKNQASIKCDIRNKSMSIFPIQKVLQCTSTSPLADKSSIEINKNPHYQLHILRYSLQKMTTPLLRQTFTASATS